ncbi:MAG: extracellular solute-binding protein family 1 [Conexibacter sp.]|nr:extracellular solute-binding protein family 1 [Conexibacter sp.]
MGQLCGRSRMLRAGLCLAAASCALVVSACGSSSGGGGSSKGGSGEALVVGDWGGAFDQGTKQFYADPFAAAGGASVKFDDASDTQVARIEAQQRSHSVTWDLVDSISAADAYLLDRKGYLVHLPAAMKTQLKKTLGPTKVTDFGFTMSNLAYVIVCNMDRMKTCPSSIPEFFDVQRFPQSRALPSGAPIYTMTMATVAGGTPASATSTIAPNLPPAFAALGKLRPKVKAFWESADQSEQMMRSGEVDMALMWSGRAWRLKDNGMNIQINLDGGAYEPAIWAVIKGSKHVDESLKFMQWIADHPEAQARWAAALDYSVPSPKAMKLLPKAKAIRLADYPPNFRKLAVPNFQWYAEPKNAAAMNQQWQNYVRG